MFHVYIALSARSTSYLVYSRMLNCYTPISAPRHDDGTSKRRDRGGKAANGDASAISQPALATTAAARGDGRAPYDMRQVC